MKINVTVKCLILGMLIPLFLTAGINAQVIVEPPEGDPSLLQSFPHSFNMDTDVVDWEGYTFFPFSGSALERIPNPDKSGLNESDYVLQYIKAGGDPWAGFFYHLDEPITVTDETVFRLKVWSNEADINATLKIELLQSPNVNTGDLVTEITATEEWIQLEWNLSEYDVDDQAPWDRIVIFMDFPSETSGTGGDRFTWYLDDFEILDVATSIDHISSDIPQDFQLKQNYPNPFNPSTVIEFGLADASFTTLEVYNMLGQRMAVLANDQLQAGWHRVQFDASALSSGTYLYRLQAGDRVETRKLTLIK